MPLRRPARHAPSWKQLIPTVGVALALAWSPGTAAQDWKTTDWVVECLDVGEGSCSDTDGATAYFDQTLEESSRWLRGMGFRGPEIEYRSGIDSHIAYISDAMNQDDKGHRTSIGVYIPSIREILLTSDRYFAIGEGDTEQKRALALANDIEYTATVVHELFHGIQHAYPGAATSAVPDWISEGMADAIQLAWIRRQARDVRMSGSGRAFDYPLHQPKDRDDTYNTSRFWRGIGRILGLGADEQLGYLDTILRQDLVSGQGLGGVDAGLREFDPAGLYNLYPAFIADGANNPLFFDDVGQVGMVYDDSKRVEKSVRGTVREVAADAHELMAHVPAGEMAELEIRLANDHDDLHLIVDGERLDEPAGFGRNVFRATLGGEAEARTLLVRVANVARTAVDTKVRNYELEFTLRPTTNKTQCTFTATMHVEPIPPTVFEIRNGKKVPIRRTETVTGTAKISDLHQVLVFATEDSEKGAGDRLFEIDISPLAIGGPPGAVTTRGVPGFGDSANGPHDVRLDITENADPGDVAGWPEMTLREQIDSGVGYPERLAMRRLRGDFEATIRSTPDCCVGYIQTLSGTFDAGDGVYHCEGGLEMMKEGYEIMKDMFDEMSGKADPGKLDGLLD